MFRRSLRLALPLALFLQTALGIDAAHAGAGFVDTDGNLNLNFHFLFPPLQADIDRVQDQIQRASEMMCDATEGQMRIASARLTAGGAAEPAGDVWYYPPGSMTRSKSSGAPIDKSSHRIYLGYSGIRSDVLLHELGHLVFGLGDQYNEQRRLGTACGIGPAFDADSLLDEANHSIMQQPGRQVCVTAMGQATARGCYDAADCESGETCPLPALMSEFSVASNNDLLRGDDVLADDTCPANRSGDTFWIGGFLGENNATSPFDDADFDAARSSSGVEIAREYIDEIGDVPAYNEGSAHPIWVFSEHVGPQAWTLHFAIDGQHLSGGTAGDVVSLGTIDIEFEATPTKLVSAPGEPDYDHRVLERVNGVLVDSVFYTPPTIAIPAFDNGASAVVLSIEFDELDERENWTGGTLRDSAILAGVDQQLGVCSETTACEGRWNTTTQRWEATSVTAKALQDGVSSPSDWERLVENMMTHYDLTWNAPAGTPAVDAAPGDGCGANVSFDVEVDGLDQVYLAMDRSYSMAEDRTWTGTTKSRLDWAKAGARGFADLMVDEGVEVGLISFNTDVSHDLDLAVVTEDGSVVPGGREIGDVKDEIDSLSPNWNTAIGDALEVARTELQAASVDGLTQAVMLLSDGEENGGVLDPAAVAAALRNDGVVVYTVPLGSDADGELLSAISEATAGEVYNAQSPDELPPLYAQLWGKMKGEAPIWANVPSETEPILDNWTATTHVIPVEQGSSKLSLMLSGRGESSWDPICTLSSPSGAAVYDCNDPAVATVDEYYKMIRVPDPEPGNWGLALYGFQQPPQRSFVWAHSDNPDISCDAGVAPRFMLEEPTDGATISASAADGAPLGRGVLYLVQVTTPNGSVLPTATMTLNERRNGAEYLFSDFEGRGRYEVLVTCLASPDAKYAPGEQADVMDVLEEGTPTAFLRQARTSFFLDTDEYPPPPPGDDCDGDGFPDTSDPDAFDDDDGDGVQNYCDTDDDGDDVPDSQDACADEAETFWGRYGYRDPVDGCPLPEPGLALGLVIGAGGLAAAGRRRRGPPGSHLLVAERVTDGRVATRYFAGNHNRHR